MDRTQQPSRGAAPTAGGDPGRGAGGDHVVRQARGGRAARDDRADRNHRAARSDHADIARAARAARDREIPERLACVQVPALPLQLLVQRHPEWADRPAAVVDEDRPQGKILWVNEAARRHRVLPGQRYAAGLSLCKDLCAGEVSDAEVEKGVQRLVELLWRFSPVIEPAADEPGVFWVDATGLERLEKTRLARTWLEKTRLEKTRLERSRPERTGDAEATSDATPPAPSKVAESRQASDSPEASDLSERPPLARWARRLRSTLEEEGFVSRVAVGFSRFGTRTLARTCRAVAVLESAGQERELSRRVRLDRLHVDPGLRDSLDKLGVRTVGDLVELPAEGLGKRFGAAALELWRRARGEDEQPLDPVPPPLPVQAEVELEYAEADATRLLFWIKRVLPLLLDELADRHQGLAELRLELVLDAGSRDDRCTRQVRTAQPTLDTKVILDLVRLRLENTDLSQGVAGILLTARGVGIDSEQLALFRDKPRRDLSAANRALARIRAEFGDDAVVWARPQEGHLPEATFSWEPLEEMRFPEVDPGRREPEPEVELPDNVTRFPGNGEDAAGEDPIDQEGAPESEGTTESEDAPEAERTPGSERTPEPERTLIRRLYHRPVLLPARERHEPDGWLIQGLEKGPAVRLRGPYVVSGGWWVREVHREYYFVETQRGDLLWVFYDRNRRRWILHGQVE